MNGFRKHQLQQSPRRDDDFKEKEAIAVKRMLLVVVAAITLASPVSAFEKPWEKDKGIKQDKPVEQQPDQKDLIGKLIKYTDKKSGFSVMHPESWNLNDAGNNETLYSVAEKEDATRACALGVFKIDSAMRANMDVTMDVLSGEISKTWKIISRDKYSDKIGSRSAQLIEVEAFIGDNDMKANILFALLPSQETGFFVFVLCDSAMENSKKVVRDAVYSFRLLKIGYEHGSSERGV